MALAGRQGSDTCPPAIWNGHLKWREVSYGDTWHIPPDGVAGGGEVRMTRRGLVLSAKELPATWYGGRRLSATWYGGKRLLVISHGGRTRVAFLSFRQGHF